MTPNEALQIAILIPCYNEALTIAKVVKDFSQVLPGARVFVFDNNSNDDSVEVARLAGAEVRSVSLQGKGNVIRRMFADVDADIYLMVDGDDTYDATAAPLLIDKLYNEHLDMVIGCRIADTAEAYRLGHAVGNRLFNAFLSILFSQSCQDILSGYRAFSRRFAKSFPAQSSGFETETELTVHAFQLSMPIAECKTRYQQRPQGSASKLRIFRDGLRILRTMVRLFRIERPLTFFGVTSILLAASAVVLAIPIFLTYLKTGLVPRFPTAILATGMMLLAALSLFSGLVLDNVTHGRREAKMLAYLAVPDVSESYEK